MRWGERTMSPALRWNDAGQGCGGEGCGEVTSPLDASLPASMSLIRCFYELTPWLMLCEGSGPQVDVGLYSDALVAVHCMSINSTPTQYTLSSIAHTALDRKLLLYQEASHTSFLSIYSPLPLDHLIILILPSL